MPDDAESPAMLPLCCWLTSRPSKNLYAPANLACGQGRCDLIESVRRGRINREEGPTRLARGIWLYRDASQYLRAQLSCDPVASLAPKDPQLLAAIGTLGVAHVL